MKFHGYFRSSAAYRCRIAFALKGLAPESVAIHLRRSGGEQKLPAYRALNPQGLVPTFEVSGHVLTQSLAIIEWLEETYPSPPLLSADPFERAEARAFAQVIAADIHPMNNLRVLAYLKAEMAQSQEAVDRWYRHWCDEGLAACEVLATRAAGRERFTFGNAPGLADVCLVPQLANARRFGADMRRLPRLVEIEAACNEIPAFIRARPDLQADAEV